MRAKVGALFFVIGISVTLTYVRKHIGSSRKERKEEEKYRLTSVVELRTIIIVLSAEVPDVIMIVMRALEEACKFLQLVSRGEAHRDDAIRNVHHIHSNPGLGLKPLLLPIDQFLSHNEMTLKNHS